MREVTIGRHLFSVLLSGRVVTQRNEVKSIGLPVAID